ncbi:MAG: DUF302 domain-containing protein [Candidatus Tectomicrobia bacterium]|nr:DUF302 domain-containing protein [Candidatus Tectomicrobia bacterium]
MQKFVAIILPFLLWVAAAEAAEGIVKVKSAHTVQETANRLETLLSEKGMKVFARMNHAAGAETIGKTLRPTELLLFGNPKMGTPLMQCAQSIGIDLPQKMLVWEDDKGDVWLAYNDPAYLAARHKIVACATIVPKIQQGLENFAIAATKP